MSRRAWKIAGLSLAGFAVLAVVLFFALFPQIGAFVLRTRVLPRLEKKLGRQLAVDHIRVERGRVILTGVRVSGAHDGPDAPLVEAPRITCDFDFWRAVRGDVRLGTLEVEAPKIHLVEAADGTDNFKDLVELLQPAHGDTQEKPAADRGRGPNAVIVHGGALSFSDAKHGLQLAIDAIDGDVVRHGPAKITLAGIAAKTALGPSAAARTLELTADTDDPRATLAVAVEGGSAALWHKMSLTGIRGTVRTGKEAGRAVVDLEGGWGGAEGTVWKAGGWVDPFAREGDLHLVADRFTLDKIEKVLVDTPIQHPELTAVGGKLDLTLHDGQVAFAGALELSGLTLAHEYLANEPVTDLGFKGSVRGRYALKSRHLQLDELQVTFKGVDARLEASADLPGGEDDQGQRRDKPHVTARLVLPPVACQTVLDAIPTPIAPRLQGFKLKGTFTADLHIDVDWANLDALDLGGPGIDIFGCKAVKVPDAFTRERLLAEFDQVVEVQENDFTSFKVGPSNPDYVPLDQVSPYLLDALVSSEDFNFWKHRGFIPREFKTALITNLKAGTFKQGASSITMQTAKNVFLYRQKTLSRKLQELFLTWYLETILPKERIFEIYVNIIEFGPGIYGIGQAARAYFGKAPKDLNPVEAVFFSTILPNPKQRYMQYCVGELTRMGDKMLTNKLKLLHDRKFLSDEEYMIAAQTPLVFDRSTAMPEAQCKDMVLKMLKKTRPSMPKRKGGG